MSAETKSSKAEVVVVSEPTNTPVHEREAAARFGGEAVVMALAHHRQPLTPEKLAHLREAASKAKTWSELVQAAEERDGLRAQRDKLQRAYDGAAQKLQSFVQLHLDEQEKAKRWESLHQYQAERANRAEARVAELEARLLDMTDRYHEASRGELHQLDINAPLQASCQQYQAQFADLKKLLATERLRAQQLASVLDHRDKRIAELEVECSEHSRTCAELTDKLERAQASRYEEAARADSAEAVLPAKEPG